MNTDREMTRPIVAALLRMLTSVGRTPVRRSRATTIFSDAEIMKRRPCQVLSRRSRAEYEISVPGGAARRPSGSRRSDSGPPLRAAPPRPAPTQSGGLLHPLDSDDSRAATVEVSDGQGDERTLM